MELHDDVRPHDELQLRFDSGRDVHVRRRPHRLSASRTRERSHERRSLSVLDRGLRRQLHGPADSLHAGERRHGVSRCSRASAAQQQLGVPGRSRISERSRYGLHRSLRGDVSRQQLLRIRVRRSRCGHVDLLLRDERRSQRHDGSIDVRASVVRVRLPADAGQLELIHGGGTTVARAETIDAAAGRMTYHRLRW
jgi:hypothetical protein